VLAGGTTPWHAPLLFGPAMVNWLADRYAAKVVRAEGGDAAKFRSPTSPVIAILRASRTRGEALDGLDGEMSQRFGITRQMMDEFAVESHRRLAFAQDNGHLAEIEPIYGPDGTVYATDDGLRRDSSVEKLAKLKPVFDRTYGNVTPGNSSQITDGAGMVILAAEEVVEE